MKYSMKKAMIKTMETIKNNNAIVSGWKDFTRKPIALHPIEKEIMEEGEKLDFSRSYNWDYIEKEKEVTPFIFKSAKASAEIFKAYFQSIEKKEKRVIPYEITENDIIYGKSEGRKEGRRNNTEKEKRREEKARAYFFKSARESAKVFEYTFTRKEGYYPQTMALINDSWDKVVMEKYLKMIYSKVNSESGEKNTRKLKSGYCLPVDKDDLIQAVRNEWIIAEKKEALLFGFAQVGDEIDTSKRVLRSYGWKVAYSILNKVLYNASNKGHHTISRDTLIEKGMEEAKQNDCDFVYSLEVVQEFLGWLREFFKADYDKYFAPILYYKMMGYSNNKTAKILGVSFATVKKYYERLQGCYLEYNNKKS